MVNLRNAKAQTEFVVDLMKILYEDAPSLGNNKLSEVQKSILGPTMEAVINGFNRYATRLKEYRILTNQHFWDGIPKDFFRSLSFFMHKEDPEIDDIPEWYDEGDGWDRSRWEINAVRSSAFDYIYYEESPDAVMILANLIVVSTGLLCISQQICNKDMWPYDDFTERAIAAALETMKEVLGEKEAPEKLDKFYKLFRKPDFHYLSFTDFDDDDEDEDWDYEDDDDWEDDEEEDDE